MPLRSIFPTSPKSKFDTDLFDIGLPEAEAEASRKTGPNLVDYFEDYLNIAPQIDDGKFIIVGRKGAGKSAFAEYLRARAENDANLHIDFISRGDLALLASINKNSKEIDSKIFFEWQILLKIVKYIISFKSAFIDEHIKKLEDFYNINSGAVSITAKEVKSVTTEKVIRANLSYFKGIFEAVCGRKLTVSEEQAPFYKLIPDLKQFVITCLREEKNLNSDNQAYIFIDDLDIDFKADDENTILTIAELIRTAKEYNNNVFSGLDIQIIILIRDDILNFLDTHTADMNKIISSYGIKLEWYEYDIFMRDIENLPLKRLINRRIKKNFEILHKEFNNPWTDFTGDKNNKLFKEIIDITFARPRDLIMLFMHTKSLKKNFPLEQPSFDKLYKALTNSVVSEIKNEFNNFFHPHQTNLLFNALKNISLNSKYRSGFRKEDLIAEITNVKFESDIDNAINYLYDRSVIGHFDKTGAVRFKYRCTNAHSGVDEFNVFTIHKSVFKYFHTHY